MSQEGYRKWLIAVGLSSNSATGYATAINRISDHYSENTGQTVDIYAIRDIEKAGDIAAKYRQDGIYSEFGYRNSGLHRAAIVKYVDYLGNISIEEGPLEPDVETLITNVLTYEKDLKSTLSNQISELFPGYKIYGENREGIEYFIDNKRIDLLLEQISSHSLLAIELKSGTADFRVFGQIAMYVGLLKKRFPDRKIEGLIISGEVDESLKQACMVTDSIFLKTYKMTLQLESA